MRVVTQYLIRRRKECHVGNNCFTLQLLRFKQHTYTENKALRENSYFRNMTKYSTIIGNVGSDMIILICVDRLSFLHVYENS